VAHSLFELALSLEESVTYQAIIEEGEARGEARGEAKEARKILRLLGRDQFGDPPADVQAALDALTDLNRLGKADRALEACNQLARAAWAACPPAARLPKEAIFLNLAWRASSGMLSWLSLLCASARDPLLRLPC